MAIYTCPACTICGPSGPYDSEILLCPDCRILGLDIVEAKLLHFVTTNMVPWSFQMNSKYFNPEGNVVKRMLQIAAKYQPQLEERK